MALFVWPTILQRALEQCGFTQQCFFEIFLQGVFNTVKLKLHYYFFRFEWLGILKDIQSKEKYLFTDLNNVVL